MLKWIVLKREILQVVIPEAEDIEHFKILTKTNQNEVEIHLLLFF